MNQPKYFRFCAHFIYIQKKNCATGFRKKLFTKYKFLYLNELYYFMVNIVLTETFSSDLIF